MQRITFTSHGETLVGNLHLPTGDGPFPAVVIVGPETYIKEQAPTEYARRFANDGLAALVFDPRYSGESSGEPRRFENPHHKVEDIKAAVDYLVTNEKIATNKIAGVAICQGNSEMLRAVAEDDRFKAYTGCAGHYRDPEGDLEWMGGKDGLDRRLAAGDEAMDRYRRTGEVTYVPSADPERKDVGMPGAFVWDWYKEWIDKGWVNKYPVISDAVLFRYDSISAAKKLNTPTLMIHSDNSFLPAAARRHFAAIPDTTAKKLEWDGDTPHLQYYDNPAVIDRTVGKMYAWLQQHLDLPLPVSMQTT